MIDVVSNPFFSSLNVLRDAPLSKLERKYYHKPSFSQNVSSIFAFPVQFHNAKDKAAFLTVYPNPITTMQAAGETIPLGTMQTKNTFYYYSDGSVRSYSQLPHLDSFAAYTNAALDTMLRIARRGRDEESNPLHAGMQLPNLGRCIPHPKDDQLGSAQSKLDWAKALESLEHSSHKLGTCLLTGQHMSVDVSSNFQTSMILFSSVNVVFMTGIVLWISASFALFHIGGLIKTDQEFGSMADDPGALQGQNGVCCTNNSCCLVFWDDFFMAVAIIWNLVPIGFLMSSYYREQNSIPLNNAILAVAALTLTILIQWKWANFHSYDVEVHESVARSIMMHMQDKPVQKVVEIVEKDSEKAGGGRAPNAFSSEPPGRAPPPIPGPPMARDDSDSASNASVNTQEKAFAAFNTVNFLSTASMVRDYGLGYARSMINNNTADSGLRKRTATGRSLESGSVEYYPTSRSAARRVAMQNQAMPYYTALVSTGKPFAQYNYINLIKASSLSDIVWLIATLRKLTLSPQAEGDVWIRLRPERGVHHYDAHDVCNAAGRWGIQRASWHGAVGFRMPHCLAHAGHPNPVPKPHAFKDEDAEQAAERKEKEDADGVCLPSVVLHDRMHPEPLSCLRAAAGKFLLFHFGFKIIH